MDLYTRIKKGIPKTITIPQELKLLCDWVDENDYPISGLFELQADDGYSIKSWFDNAAISDRFGVFGLGPDGSIYAFWLDDDGNQKIVHLGSEGDALCILATSFIDFLRLLAIGYDEIGNADMTKTAYQWNDADDDESVNLDFQDWVQTSFKVSIPKTGNEITSTNDSHFKNWVHKKQDIYDN
ncbi:hypothetical protein MK851_12440 [Tenacibaculum sp. 1B UA]|uniref:hypothetical protein n=1 Tax=unclassified Tenacibaculum TaxID=2635139 RepID=UPI0026E1DA53|nr:MULTISPECIES: hypothetical protein [unclassified Tenacibaculum]MDO6675018.1 hypothetical protein [Tenacibaculum sp. 1_MG-2023]MDX8554427.1 hypothetical protein [Tenacibaculum sp. 1B UA]